MRSRLLIAVVALLVGSGGLAHGDIIFSNVSIGGSLSTGASFNAGARDIDFLFPDALVGDPVHPRRSGDLTISYVAEDNQAVPIDSLVLSVLGALSGSGTITISETVEDLITPGVIGTYNAVLNQNSALPHGAELVFQRSSTRVRIQKTLRLDALDTGGFDFANVSLIEQSLVPEPVSLILLSLGALSLLRRK